MRSAKVAFVKAIIAEQQATTQRWIAERQATTLDRGAIHDYHLSKVPWRTARLIGRMLLQQAPRLKKGFIAARGPNNTISMYG